MKTQKLNQEKECTEFEALFEKVEGDQAVLKYEKQEFAVPKMLLPKSVAEKSVVRVRIYTQDFDKSQREQTAKEILNELLK